MKYQKPRWYDLYVYQRKGGRRMAEIIYNQWSNSNVAKSKANDFYTKLRVAFDFDSNFESTFTAPDHSNFYCTYTTTGESARVASIKNHGLSGGKLFVDIQTASS